MKKIMIAALLLALALLPACGWADVSDIFTDYTFDKDVEYTLENLNISLDEKVSWKKEGEDSDPNPTVTLILKGENTIYLTTAWNAGITATGVNVTIKADPADPDASLEIIRRNTKNGTSVAFNVGGAKLTIESGNVTVRNETLGCAVSGTQLEVSGGSLTAESENDVAVQFYNMTVSGGKVTATSGGGYGIRITSDNPMTISGGEVTATGSEKFAGISKVKLDGVTASHSDDGVNWEAYTGGKVKRYFKSPAGAAAADSAASPADLPQTGDSSALLAWTALLGASCLLLRRRAMN